MTAADHHGLVPAHQVVEEGLRVGPGEGAMVLVHDVSEAEVRFANNTTTTNGVRRDRRVTAIAFSEHGDGTAVGIASASGAVDVSDLMGRAGDDARRSPPADDTAPLVGDSAGSGGSRAERSPDWYDRTPETGLGVLAGILASLGGSFRRAEPAGRVLYGFAEHRVETVSLGTSSGLQLRHVQPTGALHLVARSTDGEHSSWAGAGTVDFADLSVEEMESTLTRRLEWARRRTRTDAGHYDVVLPPEAVADLMVGLSDALSLRDAQEGRSVFSAPGGRTRVGERLSRRDVRLWSDPAAPAVRCAPFHVTAASGPDDSVFDNGIPLGPTDWIADGHLTRLHAHRAAAVRAGLEPAFPIDNLGLEIGDGSGSLDDLVARTEHGLLLTCLWYIREVDPATLLLTGLTRDGVYVVEDGEVVAATNNFRFNESPVSLLGRITDASAPVRALGREFGEWANRTVMPALRVSDFHMSTVSDSN